MAIVDLMCYRTVNKYEFIKLQYLCVFLFRKMSSNNILYLFIYCSNLRMHKGQYNIKYIFCSV